MRVEWGLLELIGAKEGPLNLVREELGCHEGGMGSSGAGRGPHGFG